MSRWRGWAARGLPIVLVLVTIGLLWSAVDIADTYRLFGSDKVDTVFEIVALATSVALFVHLAGSFLSNVGLGWMLQREPTRLQRGLALALVTFVAVLVALRVFGTDVTTLVTSSAIVSLVFGLAVQPMLSNLMAGLTVQQQARVGDGLLYDGEVVRVASLNWRTVTLSRGDGSSVDVPNSRLADAAMQVMPRDRPSRCDLTIEMPAAWLPQRVRALVTAIVDSFDETDGRRGVVVLPGRCDAGKSTMPYRVWFWIDEFGHRSAVEGRVLARLWNALRRERAGGEGGGPNADSTVAARAALQALGASAPWPECEPASIGDEDVLPYDDGEPIVVPERFQGRALCLVAGRLSEDRPGRLGVANDWHALSAQAAVGLVEQALARRIGPYAAHAVRREAADPADYPRWCRQLSLEIDDPHERERFLAEIAPRVRHVCPAPRSIDLMRDHTGRLVATPAQWALGHALLVARPQR